MSQDSSRYAINCLQATKLLVANNQCLLSCPFTISHTIPSPSYLFRWEENQLLRSTVATRANLDEDDDNQEVRVHLLIHDTKPPFLDGRVSFTKMTNPVLPVKVGSHDPYQNKQANNKQTTCDQKLSTTNKPLTALLTTI